MTNDVVWLINSIVADHIVRPSELADQCLLISLSLITSPAVIKELLVYADYFDLTVVAATRLDPAVTYRAILLCSK